MSISKIFKPENIKINLASNEKNELFEELVDFLINNEKIGDKDVILNHIWDRENKMTTGIARHIAIPHANLENIKESIGVLGISSSGIDYNSLDDKPVHLVFLLIGNKNDPKEHLEVLKDLATLLNNPLFYEEIISSHSPEKIYETIVRFEESL